MLLVKGSLQTSSNESVATVDSAGLVTAVAEGTAYITVTTHDGGHEDSCLVNVAGKLGAGSGRATSEFRIYPNPARDVIYIQSASGGKKLPLIQILDMTGKVCYSVRMKVNNTGVEVSSFSTGIYFVGIKTDSARSFRKILIK